MLTTIGVALTLLGMAWLSRVDPASTYLVGVALPMVLAVVVAVLVPARRAASRP